MYNYSQPWRSQVGAKPPHQRSQPRHSPATRAGILSVSSRWGAVCAKNTKRATFINVKLHL